MGNNALHTAARTGNVAEVQAQVGNFDINAKGGGEETALFKAAENGHTEVVKLLLTLNPPPDVNMPNVSTLKVISGASVIYFPFHISILYPPSYLILT